MRMIRSRHAIDEKVQRELENFDERVRYVITKGLEYSNRGRETHVARRLYRDIELLVKGKKQDASENYRA